MSKCTRCGGSGKEPVNGQQVKEWNAITVEQYLRIDRSIRMSTILINDIGKLHNSKGSIENLDQVLKRLGKTYKQHMRDNKKAIVQVRVKNQKKYPHIVPMSAEAIDRYINDDTLIK